MCCMSWKLPGRFGDCHITVVASIEEPETPCRRVLLELWNIQAVNTGHAALFVVRRWLRRLSLIEAKVV